MAQQLQREVGRVLILQPDSDSIADAMFERLSAAVFVRGVGRGANGALEIKAVAPAVALQSFRDMLKTKHSIDVSVLSDDDIGVAAYVAHLEGGSDTTTQRFENQ